MTFKGTLYPFQEEAVDRMVERGSLLVGYEMGLGKQNTCSTPVVTPSGWRQMGDLAVGDFVIGQDGKPTEVLGVYPQGHQQIVRVTMQDGSWVDCGWEHLWTVTVPASKGRGVWRTYTTRELYGGVRTDRWGNKSFGGGLQLPNGNNRYQIPMVEPVFYDPVVLPVDPYVLGLLLGNGSFSLSETRWTGSEEILRAVGWRGHDQGHRSEGIVEWYLDEPRLETYIDSWGLRHHRAWEKFVPEPYLRGSPEERLALLQGLMDTDGYAMPSGGAEFCSTSPHLMDAVIELVQSLGGVARGRRAADATYTYLGEKRQGRPAERVNIKLPVPHTPFRLARKAEQYVVPTKYPPARSIVSIEPVGEDEAVCIRVANLDGLYVTKDFIVTHNTVITIAAIERLIENGEVAGGLVIVPASLKYQWKRQIDHFTEGEAIVQVIDGTKSQRELQYRRIKSGEIEYAILNYEQVTNDWEIVRHLPMDYVVLDEATYIKSFATKRSRRVKAMMRKVPFRFGLTGQPVENRAEEIFSIMQAIDEEVLGRFDLFDRTFIHRNGFGGVAYYKNLPTLHEKLSEAMVRRTREDVADQMPSVVEESILVDFDDAGAGLYRRMARDLRSALEEAMGLFGSFNLYAHYHGNAGSAEEFAARGKIMSRLTCLRMLCDNPELLRISAGLYDGTLSVNGSMGSGSAYAYDLKQAGLLDKRYGTPKLDATLEVVTEILEASPKNKIVLFSFFKENLRIIKRATEKVTGSVLFMGDMSAKERDTAKETFTHDPKCRLFLSSDAGGYGVDLPMANFLISYDLPWSAGKWDQRNARIIRLSSEFPEVTLLSMLMTGSIEERQYALLEQKQSIGAAIVDGRGIDKKGRLNLSLQSLTEFLDESSV